MDLRYFYIGFWILFILVAVGFTALNSHPVLINYYAGQSHLQLPVLLFIVLLIGIVLGIITMMPVVIRAKFQARKDRRRAKQTTEEVDNLRRMPIQENH